MQMVVCKKVVGSNNCAGAGLLSAGQAHILWYADQQNNLAEGHPPL